MSREELYSNALTLTLAGAETTASALSAVTYMLGIYPDVKAKADQELRDSFSRESEIDMQSSMKLRYLGAVIDEAFRYHPPGPNALWRQTPPEGNWVLGEWIPGKVNTPKRTILLVVRLKRYMPTDHRGYPEPGHIPERVQLQACRRVHPGKMVERWERLRIRERSQRRLPAVFLRPEKLFRHEVRAHPSMSNVWPFTNGIS